MYQIVAFGLIGIAQLVVTASLPEQIEPTTENVHKPNSDAVIKSSAQNMGVDGTYNYQFETSNGISSSVAGAAGVYAQGADTWIARSGEPISLTWYADQDGYHAEGFHLPTPPPIPLAIQRALEHLATKQPSTNDV